MRAIWAEPSPPYDLCAEKRQLAETVFAEVATDMDIRV
jgi:hypothetical protein